MPKKKLVDPDTARGHRLAEKLISARAHLLTPLGTPKPPAIITLTKQDFTYFCEFAIGGLREQHTGDAEALVYWLCVGLHEGTKYSMVLKQWSDLTGYIYERETK